MKNEMTDVMLDLETLDIENGSVILSLGACCFNYDERIIGPTFNQVLSIQDQFNLGRTVSADTLKWWFKQSKEAQQVFFEEGVPPEIAIQNFKEFLGANVVGRYRIWGNGPLFDMGIFGDFLTQYGELVLWDFRDVRCFRTFVQCVAKNAPYQKIGTPHRAVDDAISQTEYVIKHSGSLK